MSNQTTLILKSIPHESGRLAFRVWAKLASQGILSMQCNEPVQTPKTFISRLLNMPLWITFINSPKKLMPSVIRRVICPPWCKLINLRICLNNRKIKHTQFLTFSGTVNMIWRKQGSEGGMPAFAHARAGTEGRRLPKARAEELTLTATALMSPQKE